jgi:tripartite-type tricarboxylate transporter receptor subunit TctC
MLKRPSTDRKEIRNATESDLSRRDVQLAILSLVVAGAVGSDKALAQQWPTRHMTAVIPLGAGSAVDIIARTVLAHVSPQLGQPIAIENRPGAGNTIGMATVARAEPDGYTLLVNSATHSLVPVTYLKLPFDAFRDLVPIIPLGNMPIAMVVSSSKGYKTLGDLVSAAKAKPGAMNFSSAGAGSFTHFATEALRLAAGFEATHVPYKGAAESLTAVVSGEVDFYFSPLTPALPLLNDGKLQALAVSGSQRASALPNVPTMKEVGFPDAVYNFWIALFAPSKIPAPIHQRLYDETKSALESVSMKKKFVELGIDPMAITPAAFDKLIQDEYALNARIAKATGITIN